MNSRNVTITSKNQITIPADIVREFQFGIHRRLTIRKRGDELVLKVQPDLEEQLSTIWKRLPEFSGTENDAKLKATTTKAWGNKNP